MKGAGCSIITSRLGIRWFCTFLVILRDGKVGGGEWCVFQLRGVTVKSLFIEKFYIMKELRHSAQSLN